MSSNTLRVAAVQFSLTAEKTLEDFLAHKEKLIKEAASNGAEVVLFPELSSTGLLGSVSGSNVDASSLRDHYWTTLPSKTEEIIEGLRRIAAECCVTIIAGSHQRLAEDGTLRNTAYVIHPAGNVEQQDKIHLTPQEVDLGVTGGDEMLVTQIGPFTAGVLICADIQFPELTRHLVDRGANLIFCPSLTWNRRGTFRVRTGCQARAIEGQAYVVMSPLVGHSGLPTDAPMHAVGKALIATPDDKTFGINDVFLSIASEAYETIVYGDLDLDLITASRAKPEAPGLKLRRPDLYENLRSAANA